MNIPGHLIAGTNEHLPYFNGLRSRHPHFESIAGFGFWERYLYLQKHAVFPVVVHRKNSLGLHEPPAQMAAEILICHFRPFRLSGMDYIHKGHERSQPLDITPIY